MIDGKTLFELRDKRNNINGKYEAYDGVARMAVDNARLCIEEGRADTAETWIKLGEYCNRKISECREQLEDLEVALNRMEERDLA